MGLFDDPLDAARVAELFERGRIGDPETCIEAALERLDEVKN